MATLKKRRNLPWITPNLKWAMMKRNRYYRRYKLSQCVQAKSKYIKMRNSVTTLLRNAKRSYFPNLDTCNSKKFRKLVKLLSNSSSCIPTFLPSDVNSAAALTDAGKADALNRHFQGVSNPNCHLSHLHLSCLPLNHKLLSHVLKISTDLWRKSHHYFLTLIQQKQLALMVFLEECLKQRLIVLYHRLQDCSIYHSK